MFTFITAKFKKCNKDYSYYFYNKYGCHKSKWYQVVIYDTQSAQIPQKQDGHNICAIMKTMCLPGYCGKQGIWVHNVRLHIVGTNESKSADWYQQCVTVHHMSKAMRCYPHCTLIAPSLHFNSEILIFYLSFHLHIYMYHMSITYIIYNIYNI